MPALHMVIMDFFLSVNMLLKVCHPLFRVQAQFFRPQTFSQIAKKHAFLRLVFSIGKSIFGIYEVREANADFNARQIQHLEVVMITQHEVFL